MYFQLGDAAHSMRVHIAELHQEMLLVAWSDKPGLAEQREVLHHDGTFYFNT
jgi:hypothetical protein